MARQLKTDGLSAMITKNRCEAVPSQVPVHAFPANLAGFFVKNSCRTAYLAALPLGQRDKGVSHCQAKVYMTYDDTN